MPAILALPDVGLVIVGLVLLALAYALYVLRDLLTGAFSHVPVIGGWISGSLAGVIDSARSAVLSGADSAFSGAQHLFNTVAHWVTRMWDEAIGTLADVLITVEHVITIRIPQALNAARAYIAARAAQVYHDALTWYRDALTFTRNEVAAAEHAAATATGAVERDITALGHSVAATFDTVRHDIASVADTARAFTVSAVADAVHTVERDLLAGTAAAEAYALTLFRAAEHDITAGVAAAEGFATAAARAAERDAAAAADIAASAGLAAPWAGIITDLAGLDRTLGGAWRDIRDAVDAIPRAVPADLAGVVAALAALAVPALRAMDDCVLPQCRDLGGLRSFLADLLSAASTAAVLAWLVFCIADPVAAADDTYTAGGPVARDTLGALEALFGVST